MGSNTKRFLGSLALATILVPSSAHALTGFYLSLGIGYGHSTGTQLVVHETDAVGDMPDYQPETCCPGPALGAQFRLGYSIFGFAPEFAFVGTGWGIGGDGNGGAGFVGGGVRLYPIDIIALFGLESDLPIDAALGLSFGYSIAGQDFAYEGWFTDLDFLFDFKPVSFLSIGVKLDLIFPKYGAFVFTDYKNDRGRCSDEGTQDVAGGVFDKADANCVGNGPKTTIISPMLLLTFHFDPLDDGD
jgi:hypothetical protein